MIIGFHSPLPPVRSGVADYAAALLCALKPLADVRVGADGDVNLYHMGNNPLHRAIYARSIERPGVVVLHDALLHHFYLGALSKTDYVDEFLFNYGEWHRRMAEDLWEARSRSASDERYFRWPMLRRLAERSLALIVHNRGAAEIVARHAPAAQIATIPHLTLPVALPEGGLADRWRAERGIAASDTVFGLFGFLRESKRVMAVLRAFHSLRAKRRDVWLIAAGQIGSSDLERAAEPLLHADGVFRFGYLPEERFTLLVAACDVGVNLRYPAAGESSGMTARLLQLGKPVIVTKTPENEELPVWCCPPVPYGFGEDEALRAMMALLADSPTQRREAGKAGAAWMLARSAPESVAKLYVDALGKVCPPRP